MSPSAAAPVAAVFFSNDSRTCKERLGVSFPTAQTAIDTYERTGALRSALATRRRNRLWYAPEVTGALDDFAERSGRREY